MSSQPAWGGRLRARPGQGRPLALDNTRQPLAGPLMRGQPAQSAPRMLSNLFTVCGHAHALCATLALHAAQGHAIALDEHSQRLHAMNTARDHAVRLCLDWPLLLSADDTLQATASQAGAAALQRFPWRPGAQRPAPVDAGDASDAMAGWLAQLLGLAPADWLSRWSRDGAGWLSEWSDVGTSLWLRDLLRSCEAAARRPIHASPPLLVHADPDALRQLASALQLKQPATACAETGTWTRLHARAQAQPVNAWERLGSRIAELARLGLPQPASADGEAGLSSGALALGPNEGLAWIEMARGLLIHRVALEGSAAQARVADYDVLAPTDWNFHPQGAVAQALESMPAAGHELRHRVNVLMAAYDPCVAFEIDAAAGAEKKDETDTHA